MARRAKSNQRDEGPGTNAGVGWDDSRGWRERPVEFRDGWARHQPKPQRLRDDDSEPDLLDEIA